MKYAIYLLPLEPSQHTIIIWARSRWEAAAVAYVAARAFLAYHEKGGVTQ